MSESIGGAILGRHRVPAALVARRAAATVGQLGIASGRLARSRRYNPAPLPQRASHELRDRFAALGPTWVKLGQIIASSPGLFPEVLSDEFRTLLDKVPPADQYEVDQILRTELRADPYEVFKSFESTPMASASIAQVHGAVLHTGEEVVVKIQRPHIRSRMAADVAVMSRIAGTIELSVYGRMVGAKDIVNDFAANLREELDFRLEASSMEEWCSAIAGSIAADKVRVPKVHWEYTTGRVLTMERVHGVRIDDVEAIREKGIDGPGLLKNILVAMVETALRKGIIHGDLHAGNILVDDEGKLIFLDFGIVGRFTEEMQQILREILIDVMVDKDSGALRLMNPDFSALGKGIYRLGAVGNPDQDLRKSGKVIGDFVNPVLSSNLGDISYLSVAKQLTDLAKEYDAHLPREFVLAGKQLLYVERYMKLLGGDWQPIQDAEILMYLVGVANDVIETGRANMAKTGT